MKISPHLDAFQEGKSNNTLKQESHQKSKSQALSIFTEFQLNISFTIVFMYDTFI